MHGKYLIQSNPNTSQNNAGIFQMPHVPLFTTILPLSR